MAPKRKTTPGKTAKRVQFGPAVERMTNYFTSPGATTGPAATQQPPDAPPDTTSPARMAMVMSSSDEQEEEPGKCRKACRDGACRSCEYYYFRSELGVSYAEEWDLPSNLSDSEEAAAVPAPTVPAPAGLAADQTPLVSAETKAKEVARAKAEEVAHQVKLDARLAALMTRQQEERAAIEKAAAVAAASRASAATTASGAPPGDAPAAIAEGTPGVMVVNGVAIELPQPKTTARKASKKQAKAAGLTCAVPSCSVSGAALLRLCCFSVCNAHLLAEVDCPCGETPTPAPAAAKKRKGATKRPDRPEAAKSAGPTLRLCHEMPMDYAACRCPCCKNYEGADRAGSTEKQCSTKGCTYLVCSECMRKRVARFPQLGLLLQMSLDNRCCGHCAGPLLLAEARRLAARPVLAQMAQGQGTPAQHPQLAAAGAEPNYASSGRPPVPSSASAGSLTDEAIANAAMPNVAEQEYLLSVVSQRNVSVLGLMQDHLQGQMDKAVRTGPRTGDSEQQPRVEDVVSGLLSDVSKLTNRARSRVRRRRRGLIAVGAPTQELRQGATAAVTADRTEAAEPQPRAATPLAATGAVQQSRPHTAVSTAESVLRSG